MTIPNTNVLPQSLDAPEVGCSAWLGGLVVRCLSIRRELGFGERNDALRSLRSSLSRTIDSVSSGFRTGNGDRTEPSTPCPIKDVVRQRWSACESASPNLTCKKRPPKKIARTPHKNGAELDSKAVRHPKLLWLRADQDLQVLDLSCPTTKLRHPAGDVPTQWSSRKRCASSGLSVAPGSPSSIA